MSCVSLTCRFSCIDSVFANNLTCPSPTVSACPSSLHIKRTAASSGSKSFVCKFPLNFTESEALLAEVLSQDRLRAWINNLKRIINEIQYWEDSAWRFRVDETLQRIVKRLCFENSGERTFLCSQNFCLNFCSRRFCILCRLLNC